jgi:hypothetical protein
MSKHFHALDYNLAVKMQSSLAAGLSNMVTIDQLRTIALKFPGVEESSEQFPAFRIHKKLLVWLREDGVSVAIKASEDDIETYPHIDPQTFSVPSHYVGYGILVINLATIGEAELRGFVARAWSRMAPKSIVKAWDKTENPKTNGIANHFMKPRDRGR